MDFAFFDRRLKIDQSLEEMIVKAGNVEVLLPPNFMIGNVPAGTSDDQIIAKYNMINAMPEHVQTIIWIHLMLTFLEAEGQQALVIPDGHDEAEVVLCYIGSDVVFLEHEHEKEKEEEYHLHKRPKKQAWKRPVGVVYLPEGAGRD